MHRTVQLSLIVIVMLTACKRDPVIDRIDEMFADYHGQRPGAALLVIREGEKILQRNYGLADMADVVAIDENTNFRLASVTKQFTAMAILQLIEKDQLHFDTRLSEVLHELPAYADSISYREVLQHTSGLVDYEDIMSDTATVQVHDRDVLELLTTVDSTYFPAGTDYAYSNSGYALLALTVERLSGVSFAEYLTTNIFKPLGMDNSVAYVEGLNQIPNRAYGYEVSGDTVDFSDQSPTSAVLGDGGIYTSLNDLYKWDQALYGDQLLSTPLRDEAFTPHLNDYGYGWRIDEFRGLRRVHHTGSTCGFRNVLMRFPDDQLTVIILTNRAGPSVMGVAEDIASLYLAED